MAPVQGGAATQEAEDLLTYLLQNAATANGNGATGDLTGYGGATSLEILNTGTGSCSVTLQGSYDGVNWYACGSMQIDAAANPVRNAGAVAVPASSAHVYSVVDNYSLYRAVISGVAGSVAVTCILRGIPV